MCFYYIIQFFDSPSLLFFISTVSNFSRTLDRRSYVTNNSAYRISSFRRLPQLEAEANAHPSDAARQAEFYQVMSTHFKLDNSTIIALSRIHSRVLGVIASKQSSCSHKQVWARKVCWRWRMLPSICDCAGSNRSSWQDTTKISPETRASERSRRLIHIYIYSKVFWLVS